MGFDDEYWSLSDDEMLHRSYDWTAPALQGITLDMLKKDGWKRLNVGLPGERAPHAEGNFKTPSGKCEFKSSAAENGNFVVEVWRSGYAGMQPGNYVDPVPNYIPNLDVANVTDKGKPRYPLNLVSPKPHAFLNTQYANEATQQRRQGEQLIMIHPSDAAERGVASGSYVRVFNDRGAFEAKAELSEDVGAGLILTNVGHWPGLNRTGTAVNSTTPPRHSNLGQAGAYSDNLVEVEPVPAAVTPPAPAADLAAMHR